MAVASALTVEYDGILAASVAPAVFAFKQYQSFSQQREIFTRTMIINVWTAILHNATLADLVSGAMCYNMDWSASDPSLVIAQTTQDLDVVPYSVSYDCFIFAGPNYIATQGDGGWINVSRVPPEPYPTEPRDRC